MNARLLAVVLVFCGLSQADPPALIRVIRRAGAVQPYVDAKAAAMVLGMTSVAGLSEDWLAEMHDSFESIEYVDRALAAAAPSRDTGATYTAPDDILSTSRTMIGLYRAALSYRPDEAVKGLPKARYLLVTVYRIRPGADAGFAELVRLRRLRYDSINLDRPEMAYQVVSGAASGTYLFLAPLPSLKALDDGLARSPNYAEGVREATASAGPKIAETEIGHEALLFRLEPRRSYVSDEFAAGDAEFWGRKAKGQ